MCSPHPRSLTSRENACSDFPLCTQYRRLRASERALTIQAQTEIDFTCSVTLSLRQRSNVLLVKPSTIPCWVSLLIPCPRQKPVPLLRVSSLNIYTPFHEASQTSTSKRLNQHYSAPTLKGTAPLKPGTGMIAPLTRWNSQWMG